MSRRLPIATWTAMAAFASGLVAGGPAAAVVGGERVAAQDPIRGFTVEVSSSAGQVCSGVALDATTVLTAAHCTLLGQRFFVRVLDQRLRPQRIAVRTVVVHGAFLPGRTPDTQPGPDLGILRLAAPLPNFQAPAIGGAPNIGDNLTIAGFGLGANGRSSSGRVLRRVTLLSTGVFTSENAVNIAVDHEKQGRTAGAGACRGDSGGPVLRGNNELVGIISWASGPTGASRPNVCGGFTAVTPVAEHVGWIGRARAVLDGGSPPADAGAGAAGRGFTSRSGGP